MDSRSLFSDRITYLISGIFLIFVIKNVRNVPLTVDMEYAEQGSSNTVEPQNFNTLGYTVYEGLFTLKSNVLNARNPNEIMQCNILLEARMRNSSK